jgi:hypothetical protein
MFLRQATSSDDLEPTLCPSNEARPLRGTGFDNMVYVACSHAGAAVLWLLLTMHISPPAAAAATSGVLRRHKHPVKYPKTTAMLLVY